jgi:acyl carrier protein
MQKTSENATMNQTTALPLVGNHYASDPIVNAISYALKVPATRLYSYTRLRDDLYLDTLDVTLLIANLENRLGRFLTEEEFARIETVGDCQRAFGG